MIFFKILAIVFLGELLAHLVFYLVSKVIKKANRDQITRSTVLKGLVERTFVVVVLFYNIASALTLLGALKIATRIKDGEDKVSNDFFLLGNLVSVLFGVFYYVIIKRLLS